MQDKIKDFVDMMEKDGEMRCRASGAYYISTNSIVKSPEFQALKACITPVNNAQDDDGWVEHHGSEQPTETFNKIVEYKCKNLETGFIFNTFSNPANDIYWGHIADTKIIAYRIIKEPEEEKQETKKQTLLEFLDEKLSEYYANNPK